MLRSRIFISSGQINEPGQALSERNLVGKLKERLENEYDFEVYIAVEEHSIEGFTKNILENLEKAEYFLFIDFKREKIQSPDGYFRGSLFSHQELGIAVYLKKKHVLVFQEDEVERRNGIIKFIQANPITFTDRSILVEKIVEEIVKEKWHSGWRNELQLARSINEYEDTFHYQIQRKLRFFHITVKNLHDTLPAKDCTVYLRHAVDLQDKVDLPLPHYELKWKKVMSESVTILPSQSRDFDAIFIDHFSDPKIHFGFDMSLVDYPNVINEYRLDKFGDYQLEFEVISGESSAKATYLLHYESNIQNITLTHTPNQLNSELIQ